MNELRIDVRQERQEAVICRIRKANDQMNGSLLEVCLRKMHVQEVVLGSTQLARVKRARTRTLVVSLKERVE